MTKLKGMDHEWFGPKEYCCDDCAEIIRTWGREMHAIEPNTEVSEPPRIL